MIKAIFFDFDGVLTTDPTGSFSITNYLAAKAGISVEHIRKCYLPYNEQLLTGKLCHREMWDSFCSDLQHEIEYNMLLDSFVHTPMDFQMIQLAKELRNRYQIGLISDNKCDRIEAVLSHYGLQSLFDVVAVSAAAGSGKAQRTIFEYAMRAVDAEADECLFIDNSIRNMRIPSLMGMNTLLFDDRKRDYLVFEHVLQQMLKENET